MNPIAMFLRKMSGHDDLAISAADGLLKLSENRPSLVRPHTKDIAAFLHSPNLTVRIFATEILCFLNTNEALELVFAAFEKWDEEDIVKDTFDNDFGEQPMVHKFFHIIFYRGADDRGDDLIGNVLEFTIAVASGKGVYPDMVRAEAIARLEEDISLSDEGVRGTIKFPQSLYDAATDLANHSDVNISSGALRLLGQISHRIEAIPKARRSTKTAVRRIDFDKADIKDVIRHHGPYRFSDIPARF